MENIILESEKRFDALIAEGIKEKYPFLTEEITTRIEREKAVIKKLGCYTYFLLAREVWQAIKEADKYASSDATQSGSIVNYLLGITSIDPIENELFFESFINDGYDKLPYPRFFFNIRTFARERICVSIEERMREMGVEVRFDEDKLADAYTVFFINERIDDNFHIFLAKDRYADFICQCDKLANKRLVPDKDYADEKVWALFENGQFDNPLIEYPKEHRRKHPQNLSQLADAVSGGFFLTDTYYVYQLFCFWFPRPREKDICFHEEMIRLMATIDGVDIAKAHYYDRELGKPISKERTLIEFIVDGKKAGYNEDIMKKLASFVKPFRYAWKAIAFSYAKQLYQIAYYQVHSPDLFSIAVKKYYQDRLIDLCHNGFIILDLDADGLEPEKAQDDGEEDVHFILKIDVLRIERNTVADRLETYVYRGRDIPPELAKMLKINNDDLYKAPKIDVVMERLSAFIGKMPVITHNVPFVEKFLEYYDRNRLLKRLYCEDVITYFNKIVQPDKPIRQLKKMRSAKNIPGDLSDVEGIKEIVITLSVC